MLSMMISDLFNIEKKEAPKREKKKRGRKKKKEIGKKQSGKKAKSESSNFQVYTILLCISEKRKKKAKKILVLDSKYSTETNVPSQKLQCWSKVSHILCYDFSVTPLWEGGANFEQGGA